MFPAARAVTGRTVNLGLAVICCVTICLQSVSHAADSGLSLSLEADAIEILMGEAVSGALTLTREGEPSGSIYYRGRQVFTKVKYHVESSRGTIMIEPYGKFGSLQGKVRESELLWEESASYQDLVFLQSYWGGPRGREGVSSRYLVLVAPVEDEELRVWATLELEFQRIGMKKVVSNVVVIKVGKRGTGFEDYLSKIGYLPLYKPFSRCPIGAIESLTSLGDYRLPMEKVISYQFGPRLRRLIHDRDIDSGRTADFTYSAIVGGMVGGDSLNANRWRRAMLYVFEDIHGVSKAGIVVDRLEAENLLKQIPRGVP